MNNMLKFAALIAAGCAVSAQACTSWMIHPSVSKSGRMLVHKCRDSHVAPLDAKMHTNDQGFRWMRIGTVAGWNCFAINDKGVVIVINGADPVSVKHPGGNVESISGSKIMDMVVSSCSEATQGVKLIQELSEKNAFRAPNSYIVADAKRAFLIDLAPMGYFACKELYGGLCIISNNMHLPGDEKISTRSWPMMLYDRPREANTRKELLKGKAENKGKYDIANNMRVSRIKWNPGAVNYYPFRKDSLGAVTFEIDKEYPAMLSTAYIALGPQQHTVFIPTPMALKQFPQEMLDGSWGEIAYSFRKAAGDDHADLPQIVELEKKFLAEYDKVREEARKLLASGNDAEAEKLLTDCYMRQFSEAKQLLTKLRDAAVANKK